MKKSENNNNAFNVNLSKILDSKRNKFIYKNYIYNLFKYNQEKRKNFNEKNNDSPNFKPMIKILSTQIDKNPKKNSFLCINANQNNKNKKLFNIKPKSLKNSENINSFKYQNKQNLDNIIPINTYKNYYRSRNERKCSGLINRNISSLNKSLTCSRDNNTDNNFTNELLFLRPAGNLQLKTDIFNNNGQKRNNTVNIKYQKENYKIKGLFNSSYNNNFIRNKKLENNIDIPISSCKKNKIKVILNKDVNDMKPRNRFRILRRELINENTKINKMFMKFKTQISKKKKLINNFKLLKDKKNKKKW